MKDVHKNYDEWCKRIAESREAEHLVAHLREHVGEHYNRHASGKQADLMKWLAGVLNFMRILEKKFPDITDEDKLFKLCRYYKSHDDGPEAPFDVEVFLQEYQGKMK
jgi:hypothetical protein